jgi:hypothetical protein
MSNKILAAVALAAALAVPAAAAAKPGHDKGAEKHPVKHVGKGKSKHAKKVMFVFKGTFTAPDTVQVLSGNAHVRKGGFVGQAVHFDFASAKVVVADTNADLKTDVADVKDGDVVLVQARLAKGTDSVAADALVARKLIDKAAPPVESQEPEAAPAS